MPENQTHIEITQTDKNIILTVYSLFLAYVASTQMLGISADHMMYYNHYNSVNSFWYVLHDHKGLGFVFTEYLFNNVLGLPFSYFAFFLATISVTVKLFLIRKHSDHYILMIAIYSIYVFILHDYTQIRASFSIAFFFLGVSMYLDRKWLICIICMLISITFHTSIVLPIAVFIFAAYFRSFIVSKIKIITLIAAVAILALKAINPMSIINHIAPLLHIDIISNYTIKIIGYARYSGNESLSLFSATGITSAILFVVTPYINSLKKESDFIFFVLSASVLFCITLLSGIPVLAGREVEIFLFAFFFYVFNFEKKYFYTGTMVIVLFIAYNAYRSYMLLNYMGI